MADALSRQPVNPDSLSEPSDCEEEWESISYEMVCQILNHYLDSTKLPYQVKYEVQSNVIDIEIANTSAGLKSANVINSQLSGVILFDTITPSQMAEYQKGDNQLSVMYECIANNHKCKLSETHCIWSKPIRHLLLQFDHLSIIRGILHC